MAVDWSECPESPGNARDAWILSHLQNGEGQVRLSTVESTSNGRTAVFTVFGDALKLAGVRLTCSARLQQQIADLYGAMLLTPKLSDLIFAQAQLVLPPVLGPSDATMSRTSVFIKTSGRIDQLIASAGGDPEGIVSDVGKSWILSNKIVDKFVNGSPMAALYGWHFEGSSFQGIKGEPSVSLPGVRVIQGVGTRHDLLHVDYSSTCVLVMRACKVDGDDVDLGELLRDPSLASLASHEGPLSIDRQPGVEARDAGQATFTRLPGSTDAESADGGTPWWAWPAGLLGLAGAAKLGQVLGRRRAAG